MALMGSQDTLRGQGNPGSRAPVMGDVCPISASDPSPLPGVWGAPGLSPPAVQRGRPSPPWASVLTGGSGTESR